jgi:hypothetical protein
MIRKLIGLFSFFPLLTRVATVLADRFRPSAEAFGRRFTDCYRFPFSARVCFRSYLHMVQCKSESLGFPSPLIFWADPCAAAPRNSEHHWLQACGPQGSFRRMTGSLPVPLLAKSLVGVLRRVQSTGKLPVIRPPSPSASVVRCSGIR